MPVTMREVAQKAGVSIKTVSRVVNDQGEIADSTRQRVMIAITELGYRPSRLARAMVTQRSHTVGLVIPDITNPFFPEVARGIQDLAKAKDYNVFICNTDEDALEDLQTLHSLADQAVDGIIIFSSMVSDDKLKSFADSFRPIVTINRQFEHPSVSLVIVDNYRGARLAMTHFLEKGHTAIAMLTGNSASPSKIRRVKGYCDALTEAGLPVKPEWIIPDTPSMTNGYTATRRLLTEYPEITAIFAYNDLLGLGALRACFELGRQVPADCAVIGFDDIQLASMVTPSLTTVHYDKYALGQMAMNRLFEMIEAPHSSFPPLTVPVTLLVREST